MSLLSPALVDGGLYDLVEIFVVDVADEVHLYVVLHGDDFGVVDAGFSCKPFATGSDFHANGGKPQRRLAFQ